MAVVNAAVELLEQEKKRIEEELTIADLQAAKKKEI